MKWIVMTGNPLEGFDFFGPFETAQKADKFGKQELEPEGLTWSKANMFEPEIGWDEQEEVEESLNFKSTRTGIEIKWNGSHTFNVYDENGTNFDVFTYYGDGGEPPSEHQAKELMISHLQDIKKEMGWG